MTHLRQTDKVYSAKSERCEENIIIILLKLQKIVTMMIQLSVRNRRKEGKEYLTMIIIMRQANNSRKSQGHGGHGNLNLKGVFLLVLGHALGNIGVVMTALFTDFSWRFHSDPVISLVITSIIFLSALPLVKSTSSILLQGVSVAFLSTM